MHDSTKRSIFGAKDSGEYWSSVSDLMAGLMVVFLFIAISYMMSVVNAAEEYSNVRYALYQELLNEFRDDLPRWQAEIEDTTLIVRFREPEVLFEQGRANLQPVFKDILGDFFPRYLEILTQKRFKKSIVEVRIEGHTSSEWRHQVSAMSAYILNMQLSQTRTRRVLQYVSSLTTVQDKEEWLRAHLISLGFSSSRLITDAQGREDKEQSRRVEFRVVTDAEQRIHQILELGREEK